MAVYLFLDNRFWLIAVEVVFAARSIVGLRLSREMYRHLGAHRRGPAPDPRRGVHVAVPAGRPARDRRADRRLQPDGRPPPQPSACASPSSTSSSARSCSVSPSGIVMLDFDGRISSLNPAAERLLGRRPGVHGAPARTLGSPLADALASLAPGDARWSACSGRAGSSAITARSSIAASAQLPADRGADRGAAPVRAGGLREAHPR